MYQCQRENTCYGSMSSVTMRDSIMKELPKKYKHRDVEQKWQDYWLEHHTYGWDPEVSREDSFVIDTPPPTVSGLLHMGHIFSYTQADFIARYQRMKGKNVFYPMGFDDNGLPTERLVEKVKKIRGGNMPREEFIAICEDVVAEAEEEFRRLFRSVALSVDWKQEYRTISKQSRKISQLSFLDLLAKERAYHQLQPSLWDPIDQTALAQADIEDKEFDSQMNNLTFTLEDGTEVTIATTRPELLGACVAVFYHPDDPRYTPYAGKTAITPLFGVKVPLLADEHVDKAKGTGLVMCCTFGDQTDIDWWKTHKLPTRVILDKAGKLCNMEHIGSDDWPSVDVAKAQEVAAELTGLKVKAARAHILELLDNAGVLTKQEAITHAVKCAERSGAPLEILVTPQWFIRILDQKEQLLAKAAECNWHPHHMKIRIDQWIKGLNWDWCISRQRFFGVPFPIWYSKRAGEEGKIITAHPDDLPVDPIQDAPRGYNRDEVEPEYDVMDTWATSSVSPQLSSLGITDELAIDGARHKHLFPADLRPQAHEIIRTWAFYTIAKAHLHEDTIPWKHLMISGWCLAADKTKMSKSKGNVVTPVDLIEEKGTDVVRYWASTSHLGSDTAYSEDVLKIGKKLINKLWNASKFATLQLDNIEGTPTTALEDCNKGIISETLDKWILTRLHKAIAKASKEFEQFEYCRAREAIEDFFWNDFCDNYLEMAKARAYGEDESVSAAQQQSAIYTLYHCVETFLRLFAPIVPHICEELYSHIFDDIFVQKGSICRQGSWPLVADYPSYEQEELAGRETVQILNAVRKLKADRNVSIKWPLTTLAVAGENVALLETTKQDLAFVTNAADIRFSSKAPKLADQCPTDNEHFIVAAEFAEEQDN